MLYFYEDFVLYRLIVLRSFFLIVCYCVGVNVHPHVRASTLRYIPPKKIKFFHRLLISFHFKPSSFIRTQKKIF